MAYKKRSSSSIISSAVMVGGNDDLLIEILLFLPAKSLIRIQLVSKHWRSLISARSFSRLHTLRHCHRPKSQPSFLLRTNQLRFYICHPTVNRLVLFRFTFSFVKILQSCNGLLLLDCENSPTGYKVFCVCNPTTMQSRHFSLPTASSGVCYLVFDPSKSHYKVVSFTREETSTWISVYDSEIDGWKHGGYIHTGRPSRFCDGIYWNNGIYFTRSNDLSSFHFSIEDEKLYSISDPPRKRSTGAKRTYTLESNGHMHYMVLSLKPDKNCLFVFEMKDNCWFEKYRADFNPISASFAGNNGTDISLLGMIRGEREEDSILLFHVPGKIMVYRFFDKIFEDLGDLSTEYNLHEGQLHFGFKDAHQFIASLAPV